MDDPSSTGVGISDWYDRVAELSNVSLYLWIQIIAHEDEMFTTSGRGSRPGTSFTYRVSHPTTAGGRRYAGESVPGYGNKIFIITQSPGEPDKQLKKSISRSTVDLAYSNVVEMNGCVPGPRSLHIPGAGSYVFAMFKKFGVISPSSTAEGVAVDDQEVPRVAGVDEKKK